MIDTHCHLDSSAFDADRAEVLTRARAAGITDVVVPAVGPHDWRAVLELSKQPGVHAALGIHPQLLPELDPADDARHLESLERLLEAGGAIAVGECGLDGPSAEGAPMERQVAVLREHVRLARRFRLPILVHCLRAHEPLLALLAEEPPGVAVVLHSFSGSAEQVRLYERFDAWFSFAGPVTYERAKKPCAAARAVRPERLLLETDAPDQTPRPHTGRCEPAQLVEVARGVAAARGTSVEEIARHTAANARLVFRLG